MRSNIVGYVALFVALSGSAVALPATNTVFSDDIVNGEVRSKDISDVNGVRSADVRDDDQRGGGLAAVDLARNSVAGSEIATDGVGSPEIATGAVRGPEIAKLKEYSARVTDLLRHTPGAVDVDTSLEEGKPEVRVNINRDKAGELGIDMEDIATTLSVLLSEGYISRFSYKGESYKVIPEANPEQRIDRAWKIACFWESYRKPAREIQPSTSK